MGKNGVPIRSVCVSEGAHYILGRYDEGVTLEKIRRYALAPHGVGGAAWSFTPIFDFDAESGFWKSVILPEIEQERRRQDIRNLVASRGKLGIGRTKRNGGRLGGKRKDRKRRPGRSIRWVKTSQPRNARLDMHTSRLTRRVRYCVIT